MRRDFARAAVCTAALATACSSSEQDGEDGDSDGDPTVDDRMHVGTVTGSDIALAAIVDGATVTVYVCGGPQTYATHTRWFRGMSLAADGTFSGADGDWALAGTLLGEAVTGSITEPGGAGLPFAAAAVSSDSDAGLYTAVVDGCETGVVVRETQPDAAEPSYDTQGTWCNSTSEFEQVIILVPLTFTASGIEVEVNRGDPPMRFFVTRF